MSGFDDGVLESGLVADIPKTKAATEQLLRFHWDYYSELAYQRNKIYDLLKASLRCRATPLEFSQWQRVVKYKYSLDPLNTTGSAMDPGGRFNIGAIDRVRYPVFQALYIASDKGTALAELLGRTTGGVSALTAEEMALTRPDSITVVSLSGKLEAVLDVRDPHNLTEFVGQIKGFRLSPSLTAMGRRLGDPVQLVKTGEELAENLRTKEWRRSPMLYDVPANCQIFGRIALDAQIDAIQYDSVLTGKECICVYPQNFRNSTSYVELDDPIPEGIINRRLDATNC